MDHLHRLHLALSGLSSQVCGNMFLNIFLICLASVTGVPLKLVYITFKQSNGLSFFFFFFLLGMTKAVVEGL